MNKLKYIIFFLITGIFINSCQKEEYSLGDLTKPTNLVINVEIQGKSTTNPYGDGSGNVTISASADDALGYQIDYGEKPIVKPVSFINKLVTYKYTFNGTKTYTITVIAYGKGGTSTVATKEVTVKFFFLPTAEIITNLTNDASKTWVVDKSAPGHFGVGPWGSRTPDWWNAGVNEKVNCCNCFYTSTFKFTKSGFDYALQVTNPDGAFTKTGSLASIPGIPASGAEGCYPYPGATNTISFAPTDVTNSGSTNTIIKMGGNDIYVGYGSLQDSYEIIVITPNFMYLRVQGTETGNAWYLKLVPVV